MLLVFFRRAAAGALSWPQSLLYGLLTVSCVLAMTSKPLHAAPKDGEKFRDWTVKCEQFKDRNDRKFTQCHIFQDLKHKDRGIRLLHMAVAYPPNSPKQPVGILTMPLGVYLPAGVTMQVDKRDPVKLVFERCEPVGCKAGFPIEDSMLNAFRKGAQARITFHDMRRQSVTIPVSLRGFTAAFNSLK